MVTTLLLARLAELFPQAKKNTLRKMVQQKRVRINGTPARSVNISVAPGDRIDVAEEKNRIQEPTVLSEGLRLLYFDPEIAVVDKPAGLLTATDEIELRPTTWRILAAYFRRQNAKLRTHLVHRLDRDASGLLVFARTSDALSSLKRQFFEHSVTRRYDAIVHGIPKTPAGRLENLLLEDPVTGIVRLTKDVKSGKVAILDYDTLRADKPRKIAHLQCTLYTGRKHQIRIQLATMGHPICGDSVYGHGDEPPNRLALHASHLALKHPRSGAALSWSSPMPGSFTHLFRS